MPSGETSWFHAEPFQVAVDPAVIEDLRARVRNARLPEAAPGQPWAQGTDRNWLAGLLRYWAGGFDWFSAERELNAVAHYRARIGGTVVHFVHERARSGDGIPLILGHGWPSCFAELLPLVPLLTDPAAHGIAGPAFDVVIPSLPGYPGPTFPEPPPTIPAVSCGCGPAASSASFLLAWVTPSSTDGKPVTAPLSPSCATSATPSSAGAARSPAAAAAVSCGPPPRSTTASPASKWRDCARWNAG